MLSRTAEHLFWLTRHTARAEHLARLLDANYQLSLLQPQSENADPHAEDGASRGWLATLSIAGLADHYRRAHNGIVGREVIAYMTADAANPSSIVSSLRFARENARAVRGWASAELWETINGTWLESQRLIAEGLHEHDPYAFFEWTRQRSHLARGVQLAAPVQDEAFDFLCLGGCVERADHMARTLEAHCDLLDMRDDAPAFDYHEASMLLRAVSAFDAYRQLYRTVIAPASLVALLIQRTDWPGSLAANLEDIRRIAFRLRNGQSAQTARFAQQLCDEVRRAPLGEWLTAGALHDWLIALIGRINELARRVGNTLVRPALPESVAAAA